MTTTDGLAGRWAKDAAGDPKVGVTLRFFDGNVAMKVAELTPTRHVAWQCTEGPDGWVGTDVTFDLQRAANETVLLFTHGNWREPVEFMHHGSTKWAIYLIGLKAWLEGGNYSPPDSWQKFRSWPLRPRGQ